MAMESKWFHIIDPKRWTELLNIFLDFNFSGDQTDGKINGNPIGWLQELSMARRWPPPCYETEEEVGLPHERQFAIACLVATYREIGRGKSKKVAKRLAAQQMWQRLQDLPADVDGGGDGEVSLIQFFFGRGFNSSIRRRIYRFSFRMLPAVACLYWNLAKCRMWNWFYLPIHTIFFSRNLSSRDTSKNM